MSAPFGGTAVTAQVLQEVVNAVGTKHAVHVQRERGDDEGGNAVGRGSAMGLPHLCVYGDGEKLPRGDDAADDEGVGAAQATWNVTPVDGATMHRATTVSDAGANSSKVWTFGAKGGAGLTTI